MDLRYLPVVFFIPSLACATSLNDVVRKDLEQNFATNVVLSDSDVFTFGFHNFDPNKVFKIDNENIGTTESISRRKDIAALSLPYTIELPSYIEDNRQELTLRLSALSIDQDVDLSSGTAPDALSEYVVSGYLEFANVNQLDEHWSVNTAIGNHISYYRNDYTYRSGILEPYRSVLDGFIVNTDAWAYIVEPKIKLTYQDLHDWGRLKISSSWHYFYGYGWGEANEGDVGNPEGWYLANEVKVFYDLISWRDNVTSMYSSVRRIDVGGDTSAPLGTHSYYEASLGWLLDPDLLNDWVDNVGIGLTINYGSSLKGGSLVIFFNQD